jgi:hypothetical protein
MDHLNPLAVFALILIGFFAVHAVEPKHLRTLWGKLRSIFRRDVRVPPNPAILAQIHSYPAPTGPDWCRGRGTIMWGVTGSRAGGMAELTDDVAFAVEEHDCEIEWAFTGYWRVKTKDGRRFSVPQDALIIWDDDARAKQTDSNAQSAHATLVSTPLTVSPIPEIAPIVRPVSPSQFPPIDPSVHSCPTCKQTFTLAVEAFICSRRDDPSTKVAFEGGDCRLCGYPRALHGEEQPKGASCCTLEWVWPQEPEIKRFHVQQWRKAGLRPVEKTL